VAVRCDDPTRPAVSLGDSFEVVLRQGDSQAVADKANILLHGIGVGAQRAGVAPDQALRDFVAYAGRSPLVGFHVFFDRTLIERGLDAAGLVRPANPWLDLEPLAAVLHPEVKARALDEWMAYFGIRCAVRHQAAADTLATAELLLRLWPALLRQAGTPDFAAAARVAAQRRWLKPS
jgi:DNA polymerase III subunit epsilon